MDEKFFGIGLKNILGLWLIFVLLTVFAKVLLAKYPIPGATEVIHSV